MSQTAELARHHRFRLSILLAFVLFATLFLPDVQPAYGQVLHQMSGDGTWSTLSSTGAPSPRAYQSAVWKGTEMLVWGGTSAGMTARSDGAAYTPPSAPSAPVTPVTAPHDARYFPQTGFRIDDDAIWNYFQHRGGMAQFGYPVSRTFLFQGFPVQFFQRRIVQLDANHQPRLLNLLDALLPYTHFYGSDVPPVSSALGAGAPDPADQAAVLRFDQSHAPDRVGKAPVDFGQTFFNAVPLNVAFPDGGNASLLRGFDLEMWGIPTSAPTVDPRNHNFVYLRFQRGIMMYDATCGCTQGILLADYLKSILTGANLPGDLQQEAQDSPLFQQYDPGRPGWVHDPTRLPNTDLTNAFSPE